MRGTSALKASAIGTVCAVAGVAGGIAESSAATHHHATQRARSARRAAWSLAQPSIGLGGGPAGFGFRAIHATAIEPASNGGYVRVTYDAGVLVAVGSDSLTVHEGRTDVTYARPTIVLTGTTTVVLDGRTASLAALSAPDRVVIMQSSSGTNTVLATTSKSGAVFPGAGTYGPTQGWRSGGDSSWTGPGGRTGYGPWADRRGQRGW
jgi:hypothetical protein